MQEQIDAQIKFYHHIEDQYKYRAVYYDHRERSRPGICNSTQTRKGPNVSLSQAPGRPLGYDHRFYGPLEIRNPKVPALSVAVCLTGAGS